MYNLKAFSDRCVWRASQIFRNECRFQWCINQGYSPKGVARRANLTNFGVGDSDRVWWFQRCVIQAYILKGGMAGYASCWSTCLKHINYSQHSSCYFLGGLTVTVDFPFSISPHRSVEQANTFRALLDSVFLSYPPCLVMCHILNLNSTVGTCESFFCVRIGRPIRFRIEFSNRIGRIYHASRNTV